MSSKNILDLIRVSNDYIDERPSMFGIPICYAIDEGAVRLWPEPREFKAMLVQWDLDECGDGDG